MQQIFWSTFRAANSADNDFHPCSALSNCFKLPSVVPCFGMRVSDFGHMYIFFSLAPGNLSASSSCVKLRNCCLHSKEFDSGMGVCSGGDAAAREAE